MPLVSDDFVIDRPIKAVFTAATTARYWPQWHPATLRVEGDVDHPARLGDTIVEYVRIAGREGAGTWTVTVCEPPYRLVLDTVTTLGHLQISYTVSADAGSGGVRFQRDLEHAELGPEIGAEMRAQSSAAMTNLKALLERLLPG